MPILTGVLQPDGALVDLVVAWSFLHAQQLRLGFRPVPPPVSTRALIDTGAEITCVDSSLIQTLGLPFGGTVLANLPAHGGLTASVLSAASLTIVHPSGNAGNNLVIRNWSVLGLLLAGLGYQALVGRDVLAQCRFLYHGRRNRFRLTY